MPDYNDPRIHPTTKEPIPNTRKYLQRLRTEDEAQDQDFDEQTLELTPESEKNLESDISHWHHTVNRCERKHAILKAHDAYYIIFEVSP